MKEGTDEERETRKERMTRRNGQIGSLSLRKADDGAKAGAWHCRPTEAEPKIAFGRLRQSARPAHESDPPQRFPRSLEHASMAGITQKRVLGTSLFCMKTVMCRHHRRLRSPPLRRPPPSPSFDRPEMSPHLAAAAYLPASLFLASSKLLSNDFQTCMHPDPVISERQIERSRKRGGGRTVSGL